VARTSGQQHVPAERAVNHAVPDAAPAGPGTRPHTPPAPTAPRAAAQAAKFGGTAGVAYDVNYHALGDTIENIDLKAFDINIDVIADAVGHYAYDLSPLTAPVTSVPTEGDAGSGGGLHDGHGHDVTE